MNDITISTELRVPRTAEGTGFPIAWAQDRAISHDACGLLVHVLSFAEPGVAVKPAELPTRPADAEQLPDLIAELVGAGYLVPAGKGRYELVHPARLSTLPESPS